MDHPITLNLGILIFLLFCSAFLSGSEASFFSLTHLHLHKMKEDGLPFVNFVYRLLERPRRLLVTIMVCNESTNITIASITTSLMVYLMGSQGTWAAIVVTTATIMVLGEAIPKTFALTYPRRYAVAAVLPLTLLSRIVLPAVWFLEKLSDYLVSASSGKAFTPLSSVTEEDFKTLVDAGHREGTIDKSEKELIHRVFELAETKAADIMTPRVDMFCLPISLPPDEMEKAILQRRHTRIPLYGQDKDDIQGILPTKLFLAERMKKREIDVRALAKKPYFVPEERPAHSLLSDFKIKGIRMAIVVDEYGGVSGLVTLTDLLNSLFGNMNREQDLRTTMVRQIDDCTWSVSGMLTVEDFNSMMDADLPAEDFETIGGLALHLFGQLPSAGESVSYGPYRFTADKISKTRISWLTVQVAKEAEEKEEEEHRDD